MKHISLFSGIGGFELAAEWMGWENIASCEINEFGNKVLEYYWPNAYHHKDIHTLTYDTIHAELSKRFGTGWRNEPIILTGGFPCQPYSNAGKRKGKEDDRHLWPEMLRVIREVRPEYIVGENVAGLISWSGGLVFNEVQTDLENEGYEVQPFVLPACAVNAPHRRDRVWFIAHSRSKQFQKWTPNGNTQDSEKKGTRLDNRTERPSNIGDATNSDSRRQSGKEHGETKSGRFAKKSVPGNWENFPTQSPICSGDDGIPTGLDGITFSKWRNESIKAYGNAIVPQVAFEIFKAIQTIHDNQQ